MDRIEMYLQIVPLPVIVGIGLIGALVVFMIPSRLRHTVFLTGMPLWLALSRFPDLGPVQAFSKVTGMFMFAVLAFAAAMDPGPKRKLPPILWLYPILGILSVFYVLQASDWQIAVILRFQWFFLTLAAVLLVRAITTEAQLKHALACIAIGTGAATLLSFLAVVKDPGAAFGGGLGRVQPWGANQNHVGPDFILVTPLALYFGLRLRSQIMRLVALGMSGIGGVMALLTASRSVVFPLVVLMGAVGWELRRKPIVVIGAIIVAIPLVMYTGSYFETANIDRLGSLESERAERFKLYAEVIMQRPVVGIMFEKDALAASDEEVGGHAHNAFLDQLRLYGFSLCLPLFGLAAWSSWSAFKVWQRRKSFVNDHLLITMLFVFMAMIYFHGMVTIVIYYPNYTWAFFHVFVAVLFIALNSNPGAELVPDPRAWGKSWNAMMAREAELEAFAEYGHEQVAHEETIEQR
ncbi:MAG: hypothetical protein KF757_05505 [Phycisphaeraceae bacterium]|nr:hypothetical protein [Phycisphaeraceae bacterium]